jgi:toxin YoeB
VKLIFSEQVWEDYLYWQKTDTKILERVNVLVKETSRQPFTGIGKPEPLKHALAEHRFVYKVTEGSLLIAQLRYHYSA